MAKLKNHLRSCLPFFLYIYSPLCFLALGKVYPLWQAVIWELPVTWERHSRAPQPCWLWRTTDCLSPAPLPAPSLVPGTGTRELHTKRTFFLSYYHLPKLSIKKNVVFLYPVDVICLVCTLCSCRVLTHTSHESSEEWCCRYQGTWRCCHSV